MFRPDTVNRINDVVLPVLRQQVERLGETESGAYNFYMSRLRNGSLFADYDIALVRAFVGRGIGSGGVHEIGAGYGQLPLLLAMNGIPAVAIESDKRRAATGELLLAAFIAAEPAVGRLLRFIKAPFPVSDETLAPARAVLLATNLVYTTKPEAKAAICSAMRRYRRVIVDIDRLFDKATDDEGRQRTFDLMATAGFQSPRGFLNLEDSGRYYSFASHSQIEELPLIRPHRRRPALPLAGTPTQHPLAQAALVQAPLAQAPRPALPALQQATALATGNAGLRVPDATLAPARKRLAARAEKRGITRVVYFHTDHFEPWRSFDGRKVFGPENARDLESFANAMSTLEFTRKLTLFIKPHLNFALRRGSDTVHATPDDEIGFIVRPPEELAAARTALTPLLERTGIEFQLHVHHENYTSNATNTASGTDIGTYLATPKGAALDSARFTFAVETDLQILAAETGRTYDRWFFIHGHWALNASDDKDCRIVDEISRLHRLGCLGDFTCPAGRPHVDPRHETPYLARPVDVPKGYDTAEADPVPLAGAGHALATQRFLVWASQAKHGATSIDHSSEFVRRRGEDVEKAAGKLIDQCYLHNGTLYVKTHAHAMHPAYFNGKAPACYPHEYPAVRTMLELTFDAVDAAGGAVAFLTASEVYDELATSPVASRQDLRAAFKTEKPGLLKRLFG